VTYTGEVDQAIPTYALFSWAPTSTFAGGTVSNAPTNNTFVQLAGGPNTAVNTIRFSAPVHNPVLAVSQLGQYEGRNGASGDGLVTQHFDFLGNPSFEVEADGNNPRDGFVGGPLTKLGESVYGSYGAGVIQFFGDYSSISWTDPVFKYYTFITIGDEGLAPTFPNFFNNDNKADILWQNANGGVQLWNSNSGSESFTGQDLGVGGWQIAGTGAFNGASEAGILWRSANGDTLLWNPNSSGGFTYQDLGVVGASWQVAGTGDFSGNGEDILWRNANGDTALWNPNGSGGFAFQDLGVVGTSWQVAGTGDYSGAGEAGILWRNANSDTALWNPNGSGGFAFQDLGVVGTSWQIAGTGDFGGNGESSILWRNANGDTALWNPNGSGGFAFEDLGVVGTSWQIVGTGDFSGDGQSGILWRNANGDTALWNPNGSGGFTFQDLGVVGGDWSVHKIFA
jgi:hypothetical protein